MCCTARGIEGELPRVGEGAVMTVVQERAEEEQLEPGRRSHPEEPGALPGDAGS